MSHREVIILQLIQQLLLAKESLHGANKFEKNFYIEHENSKKRPTEEVLEFCEEHDIAIIGDAYPKPVMSAAESSFPGAFIHSLAMYGIPWEAS